MADYLTYPFRTMRITQNYNGSTSHYGHSHGTPRDYPVDEGGSDSGRDPIYAPCDLIINRIYGVGTSGVNTLWVESLGKVWMPSGKVDYISMQITHPNDSDLRRLKVGQIVKKGAVLCYEGTDGATGNHIHLSVGRGKISGNGWTQNSRCKYVLTTTGGTLKPEDAFFVDPQFTKVVNKAGIAFKQLPAASKTKAVTYKTTDVLNIRAGAGTTYAVVGQYGKGTKINVTKTMTAGGLTWGRTADGWVCLKYAKKVK